ncbi:arylsulfotransferase family protein [Ruegeria arenilitoris]|uniref:arylsulfotransferase family protein n=1 Tax=Ruegeria arenilitoris TaxID=1173585 RepID=UPI001479A35E|nr:arylsulfotransferase family protein [Ruegeria arenilitoris]
MSDRLLALLSLACLLAITFLAGLVSAYLYLAPYRIAVQAWEEVKAFMKEPDRLMPVRYDFEGVRIHDANAIAPGSTLITSYFPEFDWHAGVRLIDESGAVLHSWAPDPGEIFGGRHNYPYIHGSHLFPNGDILFNFEFIGIARMSACGDVLWALSEPRAHHSISANDDGSFWVSGNQELRSRDGRDEELLNILSFPVYEDYFMKVSADGEVLKSISSIEVFEKNGLSDAYLRTGRRYSGDIFHLNDIEELPPEMADEYPLFDAGDIVVSLRDLHMVMVLDPETLEVKWHTNSATLFQHDPDFIGDGWIGIFDNNFDRTEGGNLQGGSRVVAIQPHTEERAILFPKQADLPFYTKWSGKWQKLPNGNLLLTESRAGRALEVNSSGEPVWEWFMDRYDANQVPEVMEASRYPITAEDVATWNCP